MTGVELPVVLMEFAVIETAPPLALPLVPLKM